MKSSHSNFILVHVANLTTQQVPISQNRYVLENASILSSFTIQFLSFQTLILHVEICSYNLLSLHSCILLAHKSDSLLPDILRQYNEQSKTGRNRNYTSSHPSTSLTQENHWAATHCVMTSIHAHLGNLNSCTNKHFRKFQICCPFAFLSVKSFNNYHKFLCT
jgi:hypothetical protein